MAIIILVIYPFIMPLMYGYLEYREEQRPSGEPWYAVVEPGWAYLWPIALVWLLALTVGRFMYKLGRNWS